VPVHITVRRARVLSHLHPCKTCKLCIVQLSPAAACNASRSWTTILHALHREIARRPLVSEGGAKMHFIDDRLDTVKGIAADAALRDAGLRVYFADWCASSQITMSQWLPFDPQQPSSCIPVAALQPGAPMCPSQHLVAPGDGGNVGTIAGATAHRKKS
jgi:hypothetical protein